MKLFDGPNLASTCMNKNQNTTIAVAFEVLNTQGWNAHLLWRNVWKLTVVYLQTKAGELGGWRDRRDPSLKQKVGFKPGTFGTQSRALTVARGRDSEG